MMKLTPQMQMKAKQIAEHHFKSKVLDKLRGRRLKAAVAPPALSKEPDADDPGGYDALEEMFHNGEGDKKNEE